MLKQLTKKEFIQCLTNSEKYFITSLWNRSLEQMEEDINKYDKQFLKDRAAYQWKELEEKSNSLKFIKIDYLDEKMKNPSYRYFDGKNEYYIDNNKILYHVNVKDNSNCIMINL